MLGLCQSGGANQSDLLWGDVARENGYRVAHYSFPGHRTTARASELVILSDKQLREANPHCKRAADAMGHGWPPRSPYVRKLLQRNYWQIKQTNAVYAVSTFENLLVKGGTRWATQMYFNLNYVGKPLRLYLFDQVSGTWLQSTGPRLWTPIAKPPVPAGSFTGIGTSKELLPIGERAIREVFK